MTCMHYECRNFVFKCESLRYLVCCKVVNCSHKRCVCMGTWKRAACDGDWKIAMANWSTDLVAYWSTDLVDQLAVKIFRSQSQVPRFQVSLRTHHKRCAKHSSQSPWIDTLDSYFLMKVLSWYQNTFWHKQIILSLLFFINLTKEK